MSQSSIGGREQATPATRFQEASAESPVRQDGPVSGIFWESPTLEELARAQNVQPMTDVQALFGMWPGEEDDGFEETIDELRHPAGTNDWPGDRHMRKCRLS